MLELPRCHLSVRKAVGDGHRHLVRPRAVGFYEHLGEEIGFGGTIVNRDELAVDKELIGLLLPIVDLGNGDVAAALELEDPVCVVMTGDLWRAKVESDGLSVARGRYRDEEVGPGGSQGARSAGPARMREDDSGLGVPEPAGHISVALRQSGKEGQIAVAVRGKAKVAGQREAAAGLGRDEDLEKAPVLVIVARLERPSRTYLDVAAALGIELIGALRTHLPESQEQPRLAGIDRAQAAAKCLTLVRRGRIAELRLIAGGKQ